MIDQCKHFKPKHYTRRLIACQYFFLYRIILFKFFSNQIFIKISQHIYYKQNKSTYYIWYANVYIDWSGHKFTTNKSSLYISTLITSWKNIIGMYEKKRLTCILSIHHQPIYYYWIVDHIVLYSKTEKKLQQVWKTWKKKFYRKKTCTYNNDTWCTKMWNCSQSRQVTLVQKIQQEKFGAKIQFYQ